MNVQYQIGTIGVRSVMLAHSVTKMAATPAMAAAMTVVSNEAGCLSSSVAESQPSVRLSVKTMTPIGMAA